MGRKKKKLKRIIIFLVLLILIGGGYYINKVYYESTLKDIKNSYSKTIVTNKKANLYSKNKKVVGSIDKDYLLELDDIKITNFSSKYFRIKDTDYYLYYKDVSKSNEKLVVNDKYYIPLDKSIKITKEVSLLDNDKEIISLSDTTMDLEYMDDDYYYVNFFNRVFSIKKDKSIKEVENDNKVEDKETDHVSVLYYENIDESCNNYGCITKARFKEEMSLLKDNGYSTISFDDYKKFLNNQIKLKEKVVLITTNNTNEHVISVVEELNIHVAKNEENDSFKFSNTNKTSKKDDNKTSINRYVIKSYTSDDNLIKMANGEEVHESEPKMLSDGQGIAVLNYHFFFDSSLGEECYESICLEVSKFREHLEYLKNNGYKTLTMDEFVRWMYGEIELPEKSVLITVDDGAKGTGKHNGNKLIPLLEEYKMHATLFLIAGWWDISNYVSPYLDVQSHTFNMHQYGPCGRGELNCATYEEAKADLERSLEIVGSKNSFCFPFYMYTDTSLQAVKDVGFKVAFVGGNVKAKRSNNKWLIPRYPIHDTITLNQFINIVS